MILSEFAGAAHSLNGSIIVNPVRSSFEDGGIAETGHQWNIDEVANGIHAALTMDPQARSANYEKLSQYGAHFSVRG
jgi:trehalose 6-phosphate synthase